MSAHSKSAYCVVEAVQNAASEGRAPPPETQRISTRRVRSCDRLAASNMASGRQTRQSRVVDLHTLEPGSFHGPGGVDRTISHDRDG